MALVDDTLAGVLKGIFAAMRGAAGSSPKDDDWYADQLAKAIDDQIKTAEVQPGISVSTTGGPAAQQGQTTSKGSIL
jgi:hypothetical protein